MGVLEGKTALITGGSRGIGKSIVEHFVSQGANVAFTFRSSKPEADDIVENYSKAGNIKAYQSDASDFGQATSLVESVVNDFDTIDILVNNAGITHDNLLLRMSQDQWDNVIRVNLNSVFNLSKSCLKFFLKQRSGSIIHISSVVGVFGNAGQTNYAASKAGIIGFSKSLAKEIGSRGIRSNVIAPGFIVTDMTDELSEENKKAFLSNVPLKRFGEAKEVAEACAFLASDQSKYITGQVLSVCGGLNI